MPLAETDIDLLRSLIARRSGNVLTNKQGYLLESKLSPIAARFGLPNVETLIAELKRVPVKYEDPIAEAMTINETSFFRDSTPFETLRQAVIPNLIASRSGARQLSIWCGACSSGQEPYSIAILLREHFSQLHSWNFRIFATDISNDMLARTREGLYTQFEANRGLPAEMLSKYFRREEMYWRINPDVRSMVECRKMNLVAPWPAMQRFDIVFMRNVLVYFDQATKESILRRAAANMAPDGCLFLGGGESLVTLSVPFRSEREGTTVYFKPVM